MYGWPQRYRVDPERITRNFRARVREMGKLAMVHESTQLPTQSYVQSFGELIEKQTKKRSDAVGLSRHRL